MLEQQIVVRDGGRCGRVEVAQVKTGSEPPAVRLISPVCSTIYTPVTFFSRSVRTIWSLTSSNSGVLFSFDEVSEATVSPS